MAGNGGEFRISSPISFDSFDGMVDENVAQRMHIPQKITVPGEDEGHSAKPASGDVMSSSMSIPEKIEIGNFASPNSEVPPELRDHFVHVNSTSNMVTPPRTLTVDDTKSAHYPQRTAVDQLPIRSERAVPHVPNASQMLEDESIAVGLEVIEEGNPLDSDTDLGHYASSDFSDTRKYGIQVQQLSRRVRDLERDLQSNTMGFWSKLAFFTLTIINPLLLHWLFLKRR
ncbi:mitochondrial fission factor homolog B-like [Acropora millepora]|uniref:mitochondrial fission factor homolog B-like n=1 Tax=Acropora millepora TaxID=45264 RepID=UPI001CF366DA|nr:mitochondrial fission factor homolog B-like [Acropora millepora]